MAFSLSQPLHTLLHHQTPHKLSLLPNHSQHLSTPPTPLHRKTPTHRSLPTHVSPPNWSLHRRMEEALNLLDLMESQNMKPDPNLLCTLLKSCTEAQNLEFGKTIHSRIVGTEMERDAYVVNNLIHFYAKCGCLESSRKVFDEMPERNEVTWTSMISVYNQWGFVKEALELFKLMRGGSRVRPNAFTYTIGLNLCSKLRDLEMGVEIHEDVVRDGCERDEFVVTALIDMYGKCGRVDKARSVFGKMGKNSIAACTSMIDGYNSNGEAKEAMGFIGRILGLRVDVREVRELGFTCMIRSCTMEGAYRQGQEIHAHIIKFRYEMGAPTLSAFVKLYEKCDKMVLARCLFDKLVVKNEGLWGKMVSGYVRNGMNQEALELYMNMVLQDIEPSSVTLCFALKACVGILGLNEGKEIQGRLIKAGYDFSDDSVAATIVKLYSECRLPEEVQKVTSYHMCQRSSCSWL